MRVSDAGTVGVQTPADDSVSLKDFTILHLLDNDPRPVCVIDWNGVAPQDDCPSTPCAGICHANHSLLESVSLHKRLKAIFDSSNALQRDDESAAFVAWAASSGGMARPPAPNGTHAARLFAGYRWTRIVLSRHLCVISADFIANTTADFSLETESEARTRPESAGLPPPRTHDEPLNGDGRSALAIGNRRPGPQTRSSRDTELADELSTPVLWLPSGSAHVNWTEMALTEATSGHIKRLRLMNWAGTPLGPLESWHWDLRAASDMLIRTPYPAAMYWGPEFVALYNEPYIDLAGRKHPELLGAPYSQGWSEIWHLIEPIMLAAWEGGQSTMKHDDRLFIVREGFLEETFFSWSLVPLLGSTGQVTGIFNAAFETTQQVVNERRLRTLQEVGEYMATAKALRDFWALALRGMARNEADFPFCLVYSSVEDPNSDGSSLHSDNAPVSPFLSLEGSLGAPPGHASAPNQLDITSNDGFAPYMRQSIAIGGKPVILSKAEGTLPAHLVEDLQWMGFGEPSRVVVVFAVTPITPDPNPTEAQQSRAFVVLAVNPRRPYDAAYELFVQLLTRQLGTALASVLLFEDQVKRSEREARLAAVDRQNLSLELHQRTQEAVESEYKFARMAEYAPVGIFIADRLGHLTFCNGMWWSMSRQARVSGFEDRWMDNIVPLDRPAVENTWNTLLAKKTTISLEFRFRSSTQDGLADTWVLMSAFPEKDRDDNIRTIFGCITDISSQKEAENLQSKRREEALELKRQQENFIDITSHEMRNPLSAILQCADQIVASGTSFTDFGNIDKIKDLIRDNVDAANTVNLCASHQQRIVDDILTLSKLDSKLMTLTPVPIRPVEIVQRVLAMFEPESNAHNINMAMAVDESYSESGVDIVSLDGSRLQQVLINLITNAVKFTKGCSRRNITVTLSAGNEGRSLLASGHSYIPRKVTNPVDVEQSQLPNYGLSESDWIYLHFTVQDSGLGLDEEDLKLLFQRFQQSSPRTHVQYGGSGLGLFISRLLVDMMEGEIGVSSNSGDGSRFFFYVKCRRLSRRHTSRSHSSTPEQRLKPTKLARSPPTTVSSVVPSHPKYSILIVEDNLINQRVLKRQLSNAGHTVYTANHGQDALDFLKTSSAWRGNKPDSLKLSAILLDIEMPVMDGLACCRTIRELESAGIITRHLPIIAVTAYARPEQIKDAKAAGVDDVMPKPFRIVELMPKVTDLVLSLEKV